MRPRMLSTRLRLDVRRQLGPEWPDSGGRPVLRPRLALLIQRLPGSFGRSRHARAVFPGQVVPAASVSQTARLRLKPISITHPVGPVGWTIPSTFRVVGQQGPVLEPGRFVVGQSFSPGPPPAAGCPPLALGDDHRCVPPLRLGVRQEPAGRPRRRARRRSTARKAPASGVGGRRLAGVCPAVPDVTYPQVGPLPQYRPRVSAVARLSGELFVVFQRIHQEGLVLFQSSGCRDINPSQL